MLAVSFQDDFYQIEKLTSRPIFGVFLLWRRVDFVNVLFCLPTYLKNFFLAIECLVGSAFFLTL